MTCSHGRRFGRRQFAVRVAHGGRVIGFESNFVLWHGAATVHPRVRSGRRLHGRRRRCSSPVPTARAARCATLRCRGRRGGRAVPVARPALLRLAARRPLSPRSCALALPLLYERPLSALTQRALQAARAIVTPRAAQLAAVWACARADVAAASRRRCPPRLCAGVLTTRARLCRLRSLAKELRQRAGASRRGDPLQAHDAEVEQRQIEGRLQVAAQDRHRQLTDELLLRTGHSTLSMRAHAGRKTGDGTASEQDTRRLPRSAELPTGLSDRQARSLRARCSARGPADRVSLQTAVCRAPVRTRSGRGGTLRAAGARPRCGGGRCRGAAT
jgi:hypothetical protein